MQKSNIKFLCFSLFLTNSLSAVDFKSLLFHGNCVTCHHEHKSISAPSMDNVKENYLRAFPLKKDFVTYMSKWVVKPAKKTSIMLDAIKKYELMPELGFDESTTRDITSYIYDTDFSKKHEGHKY